MFTKQKINTTTNTKTNPTANSLMVKIDRAIGRTYIELGQSGERLDGQSLKKEGGENGFQKGVGENSGRKEAWGRTESTTENQSGGIWKVQLPELTLFSSINTCLSRGIMKTVPLWKENTSL